MLNKSLLYFIEVVQEKNFTKAAEKHFISQSALSKSIKALEAEFQAEFINRSAQGFELTPAGTYFYQYATTLLRFYEEQTQLLQNQLHQKVGTLRLGLPPTSGSAFFSAVLCRFQETYPQIALEVTETPSNTIMKLMEQNKLDLGVVIEPFSHPNYQSHTVYHSETVLIVPIDHPLAKKRCVDFAQLQEETFIAMSPDYMFHDVIINRCQQAGFTPNIVFTTSQWDGLYALVAEGMGISFLPKFLLEKYNHNKVKFLRLTNPDFPWALSVVYPKTTFTSPIIQCFLEACQISNTEKLS